MPVSFSRTLLALSLLCTTTGALAQNDSPAPKLKMEPGEPIWNEKDRAANNLPIWPDMPLGALKTDRNEYLWFGPGSLGRPQTEGTYILRGPLQNFKVIDAQANGSSAPAPAPALLHSPGPVNHIGSMQPSPDGNDFDRDYAGGGPVYSITPRGDLTGIYNDKDPFIVFYHGEFHWYGNQPGMWGGSGLLLSKDGGRSFHKTGAILLPYVTKEQVQEAHHNEFADGSLVEADEKGMPIKNHHQQNESASNSEAYWYALFSDPQAVKGRAGFSLARVKRSDALAALKQNKSPQFTKYFKGKWSEPGLGGQSTPVILEPEHYIATPQVHYSPYLKKFVLTYQQDQNSAWLRTSSNLFEWSQPVLLHRVAISIKAGDAQRKLFYPSIVGMGNDPNEIGQRFSFYCLTGPITEKMNVWKHGVVLHKFINFDDDSQSSQSAQ